VAQFHHLGVPTKVKQPSETYLEGGKVFITDPAASPYRIEYLRFEHGSPMPDPLKKQVHAAYMVDDLEKALAGEKVVLPPFDASPTLRVAFIMKDGALIEVMKAK
jgi:hypothetical protein